MKGKEESPSSLILSSKSPSKPLKRRRIRLGITDPGLDDTAIELLNALREAPTSDAKGTNLKPLPAIGNMEKKNSINLELDTLKTSIENNPEKEIPKDVRLIDDALSQHSNNGLKMSLRSRRRREINFQKLKNDNLQTNKADENFHEKQQILDQSRIQTDFNDGNSVFSDFSEDFIENKYYTSRNKCKSDICDLEENIISSRSIAKAGRRSNCIPEPPIQQLTLERRSNRTMLNLFDSDLEMEDLTSDKNVNFLKDDYTSFAFKTHSISSDLAKNEDAVRKKRSRRLRRNDDEESVATARGDNGFSDVASAFSEDFSESYNQTSNVTQQRFQNDSSFPNVCINDDNASSSTNSGIFTSPQRHKKRSRRRQFEGLNKKEENPFFSNDNDLFSAESFCLADGDDFSYESRKFHPKQTRRRPRKYLPPLSENFTNSK